MPEDKDNDIQSENDVSNDGDIIIELTEEVPRSPGQETEISLFDDDESDFEGEDDVISLIDDKPLDFDSSTELIDLPKLSDQVPEDEDDDISLIFDTLESDAEAELLPLEEDLGMDYEDDTEIMSFMEDSDFEDTFESEEETALLSIDEELEVETNGDDDILSFTDVENSDNTLDPDPPAEIISFEEMTATETEDDDDTFPFEEEDIIEDPLDTENNENIILFDDNTKTERDDDVMSMSDEDKIAESLDKLFVPEVEEKIEPQGDEIIEITEFDEEYFDDDQIPYTVAGQADEPLTGSDDVLEFLEVEVEAPDEDEEIIDFDDSESVTDIDEFESLTADEFLSDNDLEIEAPETLFGTAAADTESVMAKPEDALPSEEFAFDLGGEDVDHNIDQLDTFLPEDSVVTPLAAAAVSAQEWPVQHSDAEPQDKSKDDASSQLGSDQIKETVERLIRDELSGKIEDIIVEVVEKAVSKEITRLKSRLIDDNDF